MEIKIIFAAVDIIGTTIFMASMPLIGFKLLTNKNISKRLLVTIGFIGVIVLLSSIDFEVPIAEAIKDNFIDFIAHATVISLFWIIYLKEKDPVKIDESNKDILDHPIP